MVDLDSLVNHEETEKAFGFTKLTCKSKIIINCECGHTKQSRVDLVKNYINNGTKILCKSCKVKESWRNDDYRNNLTKVINERERSKERRERSKERMTEIWLNSEYKNNQIKRHEELWSDEAFKTEQIRLRDLKVPQEKRKEINRKILSNQHTILKISNSVGLLWKNDDYRNKAIERGKNQWTENFREKMAGTRSLQLSKKSSIESITEFLLNSISIKSIHQFQVGPYLFDLFIPSHNLLIECQGEYWHSLEKAKHNDASKFTYVDSNFPQYKILYLHERDFLNPGIIKQKLIKELIQTKNEEPIESISFNLNNIIIKELSVKEKLQNSFFSAAERFLQSFHYAGFGRSAKIIYGAFLNEELIAVCKFASVVRKEVASSLEKKTTEVLELDRFCIHPSYQKKNFASWFISRCSKLAFSSFNQINCLVSFADSTFGHLGTIYKAANWTEVGVVKPSYHYVNSDGWVLHKKTLYDHAQSMKMKENEYAEKFGYMKVTGKEKIKFTLNKK